MIYIGHLMRLPMTKLENILLIIIFHLSVVSSQLKSKVVNILAKPAALRIILNIDDTPVTSR
jgi:hypothetical protein